MKFLGFYVWFEVSGFLRLLALYFQVVKLEWISFGTIGAGFSLPLEICRKFDFRKKWKKRAPVRDRNARKRASSGIVRIEKISALSIYYFAFVFNFSFFNQFYCILFQILFKNFYFHFISNFYFHFILNFCFQFILNFCFHFILNFYFHFIENFNFLFI